MGIDGKRSKPIIEKAAALENLLVLRQFREAERASLELLRGSAYLSNSQTIQQRAAHVYVQAMYEQQRTQDGLATLIEHHGSLEALDFDVFVLWVALALDAGLAREVSSKLQQYILQRTSQATASQGGLTPAQLEAAARMYALEIPWKEWTALWFGESSQALAGELGQAQEAERWLKEHTPWLDISQRQDILSDLQQASSDQGGTGQQPSLQASSPAPQEDKLSRAPPGASKQPKGQPKGQTHAWEPGEPSSAAQVSAAPAGGISGSERESSAGPTAAALAQRGQVGGLTEQASSSTPIQAWTSFMPQGLRDLASSWHVGEGVAGLTQMQAVAAAAGAVVLLYAGMAERRALYAGARKFGSGVWTSIAEVSRVAFQLNPNPVAATMGGRRH